MNVSELFILGKRFIAMRIVAMFMCALTILACERASADSVLFAPYSQKPYPDIVSGFGQVTYVAGSDALSVDAFASQLAYSNSFTETITNEIFDLDAIIGESANTALDGYSNTPGTSTLIISSTTQTYGSGTLLTGNLFAFRSIGMTQQMEFLYGVTGGEAVTLFRGIDAVGFVVLGATGLTGSFSNNFTNNAAAVSDTTTASVVPEPGSFFLTFLGVVGLAGGLRLRRKRRQQNKKYCEYVCV